MTLELRDEVFTRWREVEEAFNIEGTACTNGESYRGAVRGLERYAELRLGGTCAPGLDI